MERVLAAADRLGYRRNAAGAGLRTGRTEIISLVMPLSRPGDLMGDTGAAPATSWAIPAPST
jgi:LacI family transcriptional regulator